jgi:dTDP-3-amino-3,4,6-trideoxy-alpha-D-glucose transaminase
VPAVPFVALSRQHLPLRDELRSAFDRVVDGSAFVLGDEVETFEEDLSAFCGVPHAVGVSSGTAALAIALRAAGVGPGDEVIVPAHTFVASALGAIHVGATPVLCEVEDETGLIDPDAVAAAVTERTAAVVAVHLYGQMADVRRLRELCDRHGLFLLEDAAQAHGARAGDAGPGAIGDAAAFSFYPSKNLGALGEGGAIVTRRAEIAERAAALRNLGQTAKGVHALLGDNQRLPALQAALLAVKLPHLDGWNARRRTIAARYRAELADVVRMLPERDGFTSVFHLFPIRVADRDDWLAALEARGIGVGVHYSPAVPGHPVFRTDPTLLRTDGDVVHARAWAAETLSLPMHAELTDDEIDRTVSAVLDVHAHRKQLLG